MDLVDHSGGLIIPGADHAWTLGFTDTKTAWTECMAVRNKAQIHLFAAIQDARRRLPFSLLGIDSDTGNKNDNAYVEQKNWSVVRRAVGYYRYDTPEQLELLNRLYAVMHFYVNFFLPVAKLK